MTSPLLSIVIPTYNRSSQLELLLSDLEAVLDVHGSQLQVVICDNHSTDTTPQVIEQHRRKWPNAFKVISRAVNLGMEGNIACAIFEGDGRYIWMLSDHQRVCSSAAQRAIEFMKDSEFDLGHARILQWPGVLPEQDKVVTWEDMTPRRRGSMLFALSNMSTMILRRDLGATSAKSIFLSCAWGFPHLGIITGITEATRFVEFDSMSAFPEDVASKKLVHDYDKISVRYRSSIDCVTALARRGNVSFALGGFFTPAYRLSFRGDVLQLLIQPSVTRRIAAQKLGPVIVANPWALKIVGIVVLISIILLPTSMRLSIARRGQDLLRRRRSSVTAPDA